MLLVLVCMVVGVVVLLSVVALRCIGVFCLCMLMFVVELM
jgi:hypothetical protein